MFHAFFSPFVRTLTCQIGMYLYVRIQNWHILTKKRKQNPSQGDDAGTAEGTIAGSGGARKVRQVHQKAHRELDLISIQGVYVSKRGLISRLMGRHREHYPPCSEELSMSKPNTEPRQRRDPPLIITPMYSSRLRIQVRNGYSYQ